MPYDIKKVAAAVESRAKAGKNFSILAVAEGAFSVEEAKMKRKEWTAKRAQAGYTTATARIAHQIEDMTGAETRICVPGHMQRGGSPSAYDRVLATQFGSYAASLVADEHYGVTVAMVNRHVTANPLADIAGKTRGVPGDCDMLNVARAMGISWADFYGIPLSKSALPFGRALLLIPDKNSAELPAVLHPGRIPPEVGFVAGITHQNLVDGTGAHGLIHPFHRKEQPPFLRGFAPQRSLDNLPAVDIGEQVVLQGSLAGGSQCQQNQHGGNTGTILAAGAVEQERRSVLLQQGKEGVIGGLPKGICRYSTLNQS